MQVERNRLYRVKAVAGYFDVSISTIYRAIECGQLDALKLGTGKGALRVPGTAVLVYEQACAQAARDELTTHAASPTQIQQEQSPAQAEGVICGAGLPAGLGPRVPVGQSESGS
jgi:hypothetical protein